MSIAELIMTGTERASKSTDWVADSLAKIGDNVSKVYREREQNKQAQEMLPFLQQNLQESMTLAQQGQSGAAYSKMLGALNPQTLNNPQLLPFVKLGFDAIGKSTDDFLLSQKATQGTGMTATDLIALRAMGITPPETNTPSTNVVPKPKPSGGANPALADFDTPDDAMPVNPQAGQAGSGLTAPVGIPVMGGQPSAVATPPQAAPTPAQEKAKDFVFENEKVAETQGVPKAWYNQAIDPSSQKLKELTQTHEAIDLKGTDKFGFGTMYVPIQRDQEINITGKGNSFNFSRTENRRNPELEKNRTEFIQNMNKALSILDGSQEMQTLLDQYGSVDNFPKYKTVKQGISFPLKEKIGDRANIVLPKGTQNEMGIMEAWRTLQDAPGMGRPIGILISRSGQMPPSSAVGAGRGVQTNVNPEVANAMAQAQRELPNASKDQIIARARAIAAGAK
jgi:hypothetical protein